MKSSRQTWLRLIAGIIFFLFLLWLGFFTRKITREHDTNTTISTIDVPAVQTDSSSSSTSSTPPATQIESSATTTKPTPLPTNVNLSVPFTSQAPFAVWDALHEDACEEASLLMIKHKNDGTSISGKQSIEDEITSLVAWEEQNGYGPSITLEELSKIAKIKFNLNGTVKVATIENIKTEIAAGKPVIVGAAGKILPNPNFRNGGPNYHMLVIKGYNSTQFITNDPGTRLGENFAYKYDDLINAIHDWDPDNILNGAKKYLVLN